MDYGDKGVNRLPDAFEIADALPVGHRVIGRLGL
jgi:hypothetical protein